MHTAPPIYLERYVRTRTRRLTQVPICLCIYLGRYPFRLRAWPDWSLRKLQKSIISEFSIKTIWILVHLRFESAWRHLTTYLLSNSIPSYLRVVMSEDKKSIDCINPGPRDRESNHIDFFPSPPDCYSRAQVVSLRCFGNICSVTYFRAPSAGRGRGLTECGHGQLTSIARDCYSLTRLQNTVDLLTQAGCGICDFMASKMHFPTG